MKALSEARTILSNANIPTYSVLLRMSQVEHGTAEAIRCVLDTRGFTGIEAAKEQEFTASMLLRQVGDDYGLPIETASTGHTYITQTFEPRS